MNKTVGFVTVFLVCFVTMLCADPVQFYENGRLYQGQENWYAAIEQYQEALLENPSYHAAIKGLSESFYALEEYGQALDNIDKALAFRRDDSELLNLRGFTLIALGRLDEARTVFQTNLVTLPNDVSARFGLAEIEIATGKISQASQLYRDALSRNPENRKALLSLALVSWETGNHSASREYLERAMKIHGDSHQVFYYAAYISLLDGNLEDAERKVRMSLTLNPNYDAAREMLSTILFRSQRYTEVIAVCDQRIATQRSTVSAWYLKALSLEKLARFEDALVASRAGLQVSENDEIFRALMESIIIERLSFEDSRRKTWSAWHVERAQRAEKSNMSDQALYEYRRALKILPDDVTTRHAYAKLLLTRGYPARHLSQLEFIQSLGKSSTQVNDAVESYGRLLSSSLTQKWKINPLYLDKAHTAIGLYYTANLSALIHPDGERITTIMLADAFDHDLRYRVSAHTERVGSYSEAFRQSREGGEDYFALVSFSENTRDVQIHLDVYVSRTGSKAASFNVFRTGNDRYIQAIRRAVHMTSSALPLKGALIARYQKDGLIDLGKSDGIQVSQKFDIVDNTKLRRASEGIALSWNSDAVLGVLTITVVDEDVSQGKIERAGHFDRINLGDAIVLSPAKDEKAEEKVFQDPAASRAPPSLLSLIRRIL